MTKFTFKGKNYNARCAREKLVIIKEADLTNNIMIQRNVFNQDLKVDFFIQKTYVGATLWNRTTKDVQPWSN